jgi:hypothetical protein
MANSKSKGNENIQPQSQSVGNISVRGSNNPFAVTQAGRDVNLNQSNTQASVENSDLKTALEAIAKLKRDIAVTDALNLVEKKQTELIATMLEEELQKNKPDKSIIDQTITALKKGLEGVMILAEPVKKVAELVAKAWAGIG